MNLNTFQVVELPENRDIFGRIGAREPKPTPTDLTEDDEVVFQSRRIENRMALMDEAMQEYDRIMTERELRAQAPPELEEDLNQ